MHTIYTSKVDQLLNSTMFAETLILASAVGFIFAYHWWLDR